MFDERKLIKDCLAKDQNAWDVFVERYSSLITSAIYKSLRRHSLPSRNHVEDIFHDVFLSLLENNSRKIRRFKWRCRLGTWLYTIASHITFDYLRNLKRQPEFISLDKVTKEGISLGDKMSNGKPLPDDILEREEENRIVEKIRKNLTHREQLYLRLSNDYGLPSVKIAAALNTTPNNVYQLKHVVMAKLKRMAKELS